MTSPAVQGCRAWIVMCGCFTINMLTVGYQRSFGLLFLDIQAEFASSAMLTSSMLGINSAVLSISAFLAHNVLLEFASERQVVIVGGVLIATGLVLGSLASTLAFFIFCKGVVEGAGHAFVYGPGFVMLGKYFDKSRPLATAIANSGVSVGALVLPFLIRVLLDTYGIRGALLVLGAILLQTVPAGALYRPLPLDEVLQGQEVQEAMFRDVEDGQEGCREKMLRTDTVAPLPNPRVLRLQSVSPTYSVSTEFLPGRNVETWRGREPLSKSLGDVSSTRFPSAFGLRPEYPSLASLRSAEETYAESLPKTSRSRRLFTKILNILDVSLFKKPLFMIILIYCLFGIVGNTFPVMFLPPLATEKGMSEGDVSLMLTVAGGVSILGRLAVGVLANLRLVPARCIAAASFLLLGLICQLTRLYASFQLMVAFSVLYGLLEGAYFALLPIIIIDFLDLSNMAKTFGFVQLVHGASGSAMFPLIGCIRDATGSYDTSFNVIGACALLASAALLLEPIGRRRGSSLARTRIPKSVAS